jgi:5-methylthioadenosine/S-adenosylhomocysteine deaminase
MSILIQNVLLADQSTDLLIEGNRIARIAPEIPEPSGATLIDGSHQAILPGLHNGHTHAAMVLLRGYADDMPLHQWLTEKIWPIEAKMTEESVYWGTKLACVEMIRTGTTFFNDMYWHRQGSVRAVTEMGLRASLAGVVIDLFDKAKAREQRAEVENAFAVAQENSCDRIQFTLGPHAIYTVSEASLRWIAEFATQHDLLIHTHLSETQKEVDDCLAQHGVRPVEYLERIGFLGSRVSFGHGIWLDERERAILGERGCAIVTNPCANMKLGSGMFAFADIAKAGIPIGLGTDGTSSNNNLDLFEEMKFAALLEKVRTMDPTAVPAAEILRTATAENAKIFRLDSGVVEEGALADLILVNLRALAYAPGHNFVSDAVYSGTGYHVNTTICDGKILMRDREIPGEEEIRVKAIECSGFLTA